MKRSVHKTTTTSTDKLALGNAFPQHLTAYLRRLFQHQPLPLLIASFGSVAFFGISSYAATSIAAHSGSQHVQSTQATSSSEPDTETKTTVSTSENVDEAHTEVKVKRISHSSPSSSTHVTVNGEDIDVPKSGRLHKVIKDGNGGTTVIDINQQQTGNGHSYSHSYSSSVSTSTGGGVSSFNYSD